MDINKAKLYVKLSRLDTFTSCSSLQRIKQGAASIAQKASLLKVHDSVIFNYLLLLINNIEYVLTK